MHVAHVYNRRWLIELTAAKTCRETEGIGEDNLIFILYFLYVLMISLFPTSLSLWTRILRSLRSLAVVRYIDLAWLTYPKDNVVIVLVQSQKLIFYVQLHI